MNVLRRFPGMTEWGDAVSSPGPRQPLTPRRPLSGPRAPPDQPQWGWGWGRAGGLQPWHRARMLPPEPPPAGRAAPCLSGVPLPTRLPRCVLGRDARAARWGDGPSTCPAPLVTQDALGVPGTSPKPCPELRGPGTGIGSEGSAPAGADPASSFPFQTPRVQTDSSRCAPHCPPSHPCPQASGPAPTWHLSDRLQGLGLRARLHGRRVVRLRF